MMNVEGNPDTLQTSSFGIRHSIFDIRFHRSPVEKLQILYEDNHLIAVYKPGGILVQGDISHQISLLDMVKTISKRSTTSQGRCSWALCTAWIGRCRVLFSLPGHPRALRGSPRSGGREASSKSIGLWSMGRCLGLPAA